MSENERLEAALRAGDNGDRIYDLTKSLLSEGRSKPELIEAISAIRDRLTAEDAWRECDEDSFVNVMDALHGWCHPSSRL
jgi:hypothetical protein